MNGRNQLFQGAFFEFVLQQEPLCSAAYFKHGSLSMLFQRDGRLFRLTRDGVGHNFLVSASAKGNRNVTKIIRDYGPVAPSDEDSQGHYYWLAEIEWLHDLNAEKDISLRLKGLLNDLVEDEAPVSSHELPVLAKRSLHMAAHHPAFSHLLEAVALAAEFGYQNEADGDFRLDNIMQRPATGELVLSDPLCGTYFELDKGQQAQTDALYSAIVIRD